MTNTAGKKTDYQMGLERAAEEVRYMARGFAAHLMQPLLDAVERIKQIPIDPAKEKHLSRRDGSSPSLKPNENNWIPHDGCDVPVDDPLMDVEIITRSGTVSTTTASSVVWQYGSYIAEIQDVLPRSAEVVFYRPVPVEQGGQDRKFKFQNGQYVNRVSGEAIPLDEPIMIFRARDRHSLEVLREYLGMITDPHHRAGVKERMGEFGEYARNHPERMKEPGITHDLILNHPVTSAEKHVTLLLNACRAYLGAFDAATGVVYVEPKIRAAVKEVEDASG